MYKARNPVLVIVFNRPEQTARIAEVLRRVSPPRVYVAADGPRAGRAGESDKCSAVLDVFASMNEQSQLFYKIHTTNVGCDSNVVSGVNWFFEREDCGIVLEDDCIPNDSFFEYCDSLLEKYQYNNRVMWINGYNMGYKNNELEGSYVCSSYALSSGWASWRRAWSSFRAVENMNTLASSADVLPTHLRVSRLTRFFWRYAFEYARVTRAWDFQWLFAMWKSGGVACTPLTNLVTNVGFGIPGYHGGRYDDPRGHVPTSKLEAPLVDPHEVVPCVPLDDFLSREFYRISIKNIIKLYVASRFPVLRRFARLVRGKNV